MRKEPGEQSLATPEVDLKKIWTREDEKDKWTTAFYTSVMMEDSIELAGTKVRSFKEVRCKASRIREADGPKQLNKQREREEERDKNMKAGSCDYFTTKTMASYCNRLACIIVGHGQANAINAARLSQCS